ncbi:MAG: SGNH/GDSL hydrolase family protein [Francisellaceae bacterium]
MKRVIVNVIYTVVAAAACGILLFFAMDYWPHFKPDKPRRFANIVVFGDSLSDSAALNSDDRSGNNTWVMAQGVSSPVGAPITSEVSLSNPERKTWLNYLIDSSHFTTADGRLYLLRGDNHQVSAFTHNFSYAVASAQTGDNYIDDKHVSPWPVMSAKDCDHGLGDYGAYSCVPGLMKQVALYLADVDDHPNPHTLFILWAGGNDFYQNIIKLLSDSRLTLSHPIDNTISAVNLLLDHGVSADNIYVLNLPDFAMVPAVRSLLAQKLKNPRDDKMALYAVSMISDLYNLTLKNDLFIKTYGRFKPDHVFGLDKRFLAIYENKQIQRALRIDKPVGLTCVKANALPYCRGFLFYNDMHPTSPMHAYLAGQLKAYIGIA